MVLIAGVDSSTQSTKIELRDQHSGEVVGRGSAPHPNVTPPTSEQDPTSWLAAFESALTEARQSAAEQSDGRHPISDHEIAAISVGGQQHGMIALDAAGAAIHPAKLWNDTESADDADWLVDQLGADGWAEAVGSVPVAAFTVTKLRWLRRTHPEAWSRLDRVMLPHDYVTASLTGQFTTDRGDASGTGYWSPASGDYRWDILSLVDPDREWRQAVPRVLGPLEAAGTWVHGGNGALVAPGSGDNMAGALGVGLRTGDAVISIGTSGTVYAVSDAPTADPTGAVAGFADATGRFLPLVCTSNAAKVLDAVRRLLGVDHDEFDRMALSADAGGPVLLPYFDGERTPYRPEATGLVDGLRTDVTREQFARAAVDGVVCGLLDGLDALRAHAAVTGRIVLTGGGARSRAVCAVLAGLVDLPVVVSDTQEAVATGAAVQAASMLEQVSAETIQDRWRLGAGSPVDAGLGEGPDAGLDAGLDADVENGPVAGVADVRARYAAVRDRWA